MSREVTLINKNSGRKTLVGDGKIKLNLSIGLSPVASNIEEELRKAIVGERMGVDMITDNSIGRKECIEFYEELSKFTKLPYGGLVVYYVENFALKEGRSKVYTEEDFFKSFEFIVNQKSSFVEIHPTLTRNLLKKINFKKRPIVSRSGGILAEYMLKENVENPLFKNYNYFLEMARNNEVALIIGTCLRPGSLRDSFDELHLEEIKLQKELVKKAHEEHVQVMVEVLGHIRLVDIEKYRILRKEIDAPIGALGPILTDTGIGMDHIVAAIGMVCVSDYVDWCSVITPMEHLGLPREQDIIEGIRSANIARHIIALLRGEEYEKEDSEFISGCRSFPCSMCGEEYCPLRLTRGEIFESS